MGNSTDIKVEKIIGCRISEAESTAQIRLVDGENTFTLNCAQDILTALAITALSANSAMDAKAGSITGAPSVLRGFICDRWEISTSSDHKNILISFRVQGGAWIRLQIPAATAGPMRETLQAVESQSLSPGANPSRWN